MEARHDVSYILLALKNAHKKMTRPINILFFIPLGRVTFLWAVLIARQKKETDMLTAAGLFFYLFSRVSICLSFLLAVAGGHLTCRYRKRAEMFLFPFFPFRALPLTTERKMSSACQLSDNERHFYFLFALIAQLMAANKYAARGQLPSSFLFFL